jgi:hypothetical protein
LSPSTDVFCLESSFFGKKQPVLLCRKIDEPNKRFPKLIHVRAFLNNGSSGGGLFLSNGICVGIADRGYEENVEEDKNSGFFRSVRSICEWAKRNGSFEKFFPEVVGVRKSKKERRSE